MKINTPRFIDKIIFSSKNRFTEKNCSCFINNTNINQNLFSNIRILILFKQSENHSYGEFLDIVH